jgi:hypothetical protein
MFEAGILVLEALEAVYTAVESKRQILLVALKMVSRQ